MGPIVISGLLAACGGGGEPAPSPSPDAAVAADDGAAVPADAPVVADVAAVADGEAGAGAREAGRDRPDAPEPYARPQYTRLAETGLYSDPVARTIAPGLREFTPNHALWSDGAAKRRWIALPPGTQIDSGEPDRWRFPIGTRFWKEFSLGGVRLETRLVERYGPGREDFWMGAFVWNAAQTEAVFVELGQADVNGTPHDVPSQRQCWSCHLGEPGRGLGFSAVQLSGPGEGVRLQALIDEDLLTHPPARVDFRPPGDAVTAAALGYLHANCAHCHNPSGTSWPDTQMDLRLETTDTAPERTAAYRTTVGKHLQYFRHPALTARVIPGDPAASALLYRMQVRADKISMPPLATELIDPAGVESVRRWIEGLLR